MRIQRAGLGAPLVVCFVALTFLPAFSQSVTVSPTSISFGDQADGTTSSVHKVTLTNGQSSAITINSITTSQSVFGETNNCPMSPSTLKAGGTCTISVTFSPNAQGAFTGTLTVVDTGLSSPQTASLSGTGTAPILESIAVTPSTASVVVALTEQFTATGTYSDGSTQNLTTTASWSSSSTSVATIGLHTGLAKGVAPGTVTIAASSGSIKGLATLTVTAAVLTSISVTPASPSVPAGETEQFTATGTYNNGTTQNLTDSVTWTSSATSIATVNSTGLATTIEQGTATITATSGTISGSATLTVTAAVLTSIAVTPSNPSIAIGSTEQFTATGTYSNGSTQNLTTTVSWTSSATSVATIKLHTGLATAVAAGTATITASSGTIKGTTTLTVNPTLVSISVTPSTASIAAGYTQQFTATGTYNNGTTQNLTATASWTSSATSVATVSAGLATGVAQGTATITATSGTISGSAALTVTAPVLTSITITPGTASIAAGYTQQFTATGNYSNGSTQNLTSSATWTSSATSVATVSAGLATGLAQGTATITATSGTIGGSATLTVTAPVLTSITVTPSTVSVAAGYAQQFTATGNYSNGSTQNLTNSASWTSSNTAAATVNSAGLATGVAQGSATITATSGAISGSAALTVTAPVLTSISVSPTSVTIPNGSTQQFTATGSYSDGSTQNLTSSAGWSSSLTSVATIAAGGLATGVGAGSTTITAASGSITGTATLTVDQAVLVSISVTPADPSFALGTTLPLIATGTYSDGSTLNLTATSTWSSANTNIATVNSQGVVSSAGVGSVSITATSGTISGLATVNVTSATLVSIAVTPAIPTLPLNLTQQFTATGTFSDGSTQNITSTVQWSSGTPAVATISNTGLATTVATGTSTIVASSGTVSGSSTLTVTSATLQSITASPATPSIAPGTTEQFTATGNYSDGSTQNLTTLATWSSDTPAAATINSLGLAQSVATGAATITAAFGSASGSALLTVTSATPSTISINPTSPAIAAGTTQQFTATATFSDGTTQDATQIGHWSSTSSTVATISDTPGAAGLAGTLSSGTTTIEISWGSVSASATLVVNPVVLTSIAINQQNPGIALGATEQFTATGTFSDGSTQGVTSVVMWSSSDAAVAIISNTPGSDGLATSSGSGSATISASLNSVSSSTMLTVSAALVSIAIAPQNPTIALETTQQFTATGTYADGSTQILTSVAIWSSSNTGVATVSNSPGSNGLATGIAAGTATISAASGSISGSTSLTVAGPTLQSIAVTPLSATVTIGETQQFTATGTYSDGSTQNLTTAVMWSSSNTAVATISNSGGSQGLASGVNSGTASITATLGSITSSPAASLTVTPILVSISLSPQSPTISLGSNQQFTATGNYSDGSTQNLTDLVTWTSGTLTVATISNSSGSQGLATSIDEGTSTISATLGVSASTELTVVPLGAWTQHGPVGRSSHSMVWDPNSHLMIIFGGQEATTGTSLNDVWLGATSTTEDDSFVAESPTGTAPEGRYGHVATYDSNSNRMMMFGGFVGASSSCANDFWILTGANGQSGTPSWISATPSGVAPAARVYAGGVYDPNTNSVIIFGGSNCSGEYFNDVWVLSNANGESGTSVWTELSPSGTAPTARESASAVYDSTNNILIIYGGDAGSSSLFTDVWVLSNANGTGGTPTWTSLAPTGTAPQARTGQTAIFDSVNDRMTIFGGINSSGTTFSDAWVLTYANGIGGTPAWSEIPAQGTAPSLAYHTAVYDSSKDNMYVFGGSSSESKLQGSDHAFTLNGANGISSVGEKWVLGGPPVRYAHSAFYDSVTNSLFIFGGQHAVSAIDFNDYWQESGVIGSTNLQWLLLGTGGATPSARFGHTGLYDSGSNRMMVFGGATGFPSPCVNDYHVLEHANNQGGSLTWLSITPTGTAPGVRTHHVSAYDSNTNTIIIFSGWNCNSTYYNDVWILQNANDAAAQPNWVQLQPTGTAPSGRESSSGVYDPTTNSLIVYGGDAGGEPLGDIWILSNANGTGGTPAWTELSPSNGGPVARSGHTATYDSVNNVMTIYAGFNGTSILSDTWVLSGANGQAGSAIWTQLTAGQVRRFHTSNYDPSSDEMITYGGATGTEPQNPTSDAYSLSDANNIP